MINEFKDREGNRWAIDLPIGTVLRVKAESEGRLNLLDPQHENLADRLAAHDFETLYELLWLILRPSAEAKEINAEKFGQRDWIRNNRRGDDPAFDDFEPKRWIKIQKLGEPRGCRNRLCFGLGVFRIAPLQLDRGSIGIRLAAQSGLGVLKSQPRDL